MAPRLAALGMAGGTIRGYGCPGTSNVAAGLAVELARADGSVGTLNGVHRFRGDAVDRPARERGAAGALLPAMARMERIGAFGLTERRHGSDAVGPETSPRRDGDAYVLDGQTK